MPLEIPISDLPPNCTGWTPPWALGWDSNNQPRLNGEYPALRQQDGPNGTAHLRVHRNHNGDHHAALYEDYRKFAVGPERDWSGYLHVASYTYDPNAIPPPDTSAADWNKIVTHKQDPP